MFDHGQRIERVENVKDVVNYITRIDEMIERKREGIAKMAVDGKERRILEKRTEDK